MTKMPRISMWKETRHTNDFKFHDGVISEQFTVGATGMHVHKYLGPKEVTGSDDDTQPDIIDPTENDIQDILFLENRDRKYDPDIYNLRGMYQMSDTDFDLSQFGLFLNSDTIYITFHLKDMNEMVGRSLIAGDVIELPHLKDFYALNDDIPAALKRYYMVQDGSRPSEGYSPTWFPHLWRVKCTPLVDSQEMKGLFELLGADGNPKDDAFADGGDDGNNSTFDIFSAINGGIVAQAENDVPESGYDTSAFFVAPTDEGDARLNENLTADLTSFPGANEIGLTADSTGIYASSTGISPSNNTTGEHYMTGDGKAPNGYPVTEGIEFPGDAVMGDFVLRLDYLPNRLFRYDGKNWIKIEDRIRASLSAGSDDTLLGGFVNNANNTNGGRDDKCYGSTEERQALSEILRPKADN